MYLSRLFREGGAGIKFALVFCLAGVEAPAFVLLSRRREGSSLQFPDCSLKEFFGTGGRKFG